MEARKLNKIKKVIRAALPQGLNKSTLALIKKLKLKVGDKVKLSKAAAAFDRSIDNLFKMHTIGGVIKDTSGLQSAIQFYLIGQGIYKYAKILNFNDDASGQKKPIPGVFLEFHFKDGTKMTSWYYAKDITKMV